MLLERVLHQLAGQLGPVRQLPQQLQDGSRRLGRLRIHALLPNLADQTDELLSDPVPRSLPLVSDQPVEQVKLGQVEFARGGRQHAVHVVHNVGVLALAQVPDVG